MKNKPLFAVLGLALAACGTTPATKVKQVVKKPAVLQLYVMSQCPYGVQVVNAVAPVVEKLGANVDVRVDFIGDKSDKGLSSMHGDKEVKGDLAQICAANLAPGKFMQFVTCQNKNVAEVDINWEKCATETQIDAKKLKDCLEGPQGQKLLEASFAKARERGASGSPTMFLNDKPYQGGRKTSDFLRAICDEFAGQTLPEACTNIPEAPKVKGISFSDARCADCNMAGIEARLKSDFRGLELTKVDYMSDEGKKLYAELQAKDPSFKYLPIFLLDANAEKDTEGYDAIKRWLRPLGEYRALAVGGKFDPTAEICDNKIDDDGNKLADCNDATCKNSMVCRTEKPKNLSLFVMSQCPYGAKAVLAMKEVMANFGADLKLDVHFIGDVRNGEPNSMHGPAEVEEDMRQACAIKYYSKGNKYLDYLTCRAADYRNNTWQPCTGNNGIDAEVIKKCVAKEGKELLIKDFAVARELNIGGSPTFLANNKYSFNGLDAETIKTNFCKYNSGVKGCSATLSTDKSVQGSCK